MVVCDPVVLAGKLVLISVRGNPYKDVADKCRSKSLEYHLLQVTVLEGSRNDL
jgi:hypothetical protein